jgi:hypothetical protein
MKPPGRWSGQTHHHSCSGAMVPGAEAAVANDSSGADEGDGRGLAWRLRAGHQRDACEAAVENLLGGRFPSLRDDGEPEPSLYCLTVQSKLTRSYPEPSQDDLSLEYYPTIWVFTPIVARADPAIQTIDV